MNINKLVYSYLDFKSSFTFDVGPFQVAPLYETSIELQQAIQSAQDKLVLQVAAFRNIAKIFGSPETLKGLPQLQIDKFSDASTAADAVADQIDKSAANAIGLFATCTSNVYR
jgi:hypothetical protein